MDYARSLAIKIQREISADLDTDELAAYAARGLVEAAERFDPSRGVAFTTFSYYRIRGAIFDGLREIGWLKRSEYARFQAAANDLLENVSERSGPPPEGQDAASTLREVGQTLDQLATVFVTSLAEGQQIRDERTPRSDEAVEHREACRVVRGAVRQLPDRERRLIELYYFEDRTLQAAGAELGLSKSWTCRLHARAIKLLTEALGTTFD